MTDKKQAVVTALRGLAHSFGELAKAHRVAQSAIHDYSLDIEHSDEPQNLLSSFPPLFGNLEQIAGSVGQVKPKPAPKQKAISVAPASNGAAPSGNDEDVDGEDKKRKRGPNKEKKVKDPNAPKRPASAYIEYQNSVRDDFRNRYSDLPYSEVLKKIGNAWAEMDDEAKKPFNDIMEAKKATYLSEKKTYESTHGPPQTVPAGSAPASAGGAGTSATGEAKEYTGKKRGRKSNAERAMMAAQAATAGVDAPPVSTASSSKQPADIPVDAPSKKVVEESDDDSDEDDSEDDDSSEDDSSEESEVESSPAPAPPVVVKKEKKQKSEKHKSKKSKTA